MAKWKCRVCGFVYDEAKGLPEQGFKPSTKFKELPADWICPLCGVGKEFFDEIKEGA
jgi:rubredoxin